MERLIVFGCSITYGHGLPDCIGELDTQPSNMGWASIAAKYMNKECVNLAKPGISNKHIWHKIVNFKFQETDTVIIQWTFPSRTSVITKKSVVDVGAWNYEQYLNYYEADDSILMTKLFVSHANMLLASKNIKVHHIVLERKDKEWLKLGTDTIDHIPVYIHPLEERYAKAADSHHPGIECHEVYAKKILDFLKVENNLTNHKPLSVITRFIRKHKDRNNLRCK